MNITSHRLPNGQYALRNEGSDIGRAWRYQPRSNGRRRSGWGVIVNGYYWRNGEANQRSGSVGTDVKTLRAACELAGVALESKTPPSV